MRGLVIAVVGLAACGDKPGVYLEIHGSQQLAQVAVYIGRDACTDQGGAPCAIAPPQLDRIHPAAPGGTWFRDIDTAFTSSASGGVARVHVEATSANEVVQIVVLGLDSQGTPIQDALVHDVAVPQGTTKQVTLTLADALPVTGNEEDMQPHPDGDYVLDWTHTGAPTDCVLVEHWEAGTGEHVFVVPTEDADCDGVLTGDPLECDPYWYESSSTPTGQATCATLGHVDGTSTCLLGGDGCVDGVGKTGTCAPSDPTTCVPDAICNSACARSSNTSLSSCTSASIGPMIHCVIYAIADQGLPCPGGSAPSLPTHGTLLLDGLFTSSSRTCKDVSFAPVDSLYGLSAQLRSRKLFAPATSTAELDVGNPLPTGNCDFDMTWAAGAFAMNLTPQHGVADIAIDNDDHVILPVLLDYVPCLQAPPSATDGFTCYVPTLLNDGVLNCAR